MAQDDSVVRLDTRLSGQLKRYHTWPIIGQQTVAEHCWQILRIYLSVVDKIDSHMVQHIMFHDIGETFIGDLPYPVKSENPKLKEQLDPMELNSQLMQLDYWGTFRSVMLTEQDRVLFKQIELTEMAEFGLDQLCLGNSHAFIIADRCLRVVYHSEPPARLVQYVIKRINLFFKQYKNTLRGPLGDWWSVMEWNERLTHGFKLEETHEGE
jgi:5'-deoxynucleotidase YfbR-like HD superfamily hydrolase